MRLPLVDGQGNFGSVDGDPAGGHAIHRGPPRQARDGPARRSRQGDGRLPAELSTAPSRSRRSSRRAFRTCWSTARAASPSAWRPTSRRTTSARSSTACIAYIDDPDITHRRADGAHPGARFPDRRHHPRPRAAFAHAYNTGRGSIIMRAQDRRSRRSARIARRSSSRRSRTRSTRRTLIEKIADLVRDKRVEGISDLRDESDRDGMRIVIEIKRDADGRRGAEPALRATPRCRRASAPTWWRSTAAARRCLNLKDFDRAPSSTSARTSSAGARASCSARRATAPTCSSASPSRSPTSTKSSTPSAPRRTPTRRARR